MSLFSPYCSLKSKWQRRAKKRERKRRGAYWSIGCAESDSPLQWDPANAAVLSVKDIDEDLFFIADPFLHIHEGERYMFFETMKRGSDKGVIQCAKYNRIQKSWEQLGTVLAEPFHLSYPQVFAVGKDIYMIPESKKARRVGLYKAVDFPTKWEYVAPLLRGVKRVDNTIIKHDGVWYLFSSRKKRLYLYMSNHLTGPWRGHPGNPVRRGNFSRCAGRIIEYGGKLYRMAQDQCGYGAGVYAFEIKELTPSRYAEVPAESINPVLLPGTASWNETGTHHVDSVKIDAGKYFGVFDGERFAS